MRDVGRVRSSRNDDSEVKFAAVLLQVFLNLRALSHLKHTMAIARVSKHTYLNDHVSSVIYIFHHTKPLSNTSNTHKMQKGYFLSPRIVLKELQLDVPGNVFV